MSEVFQVRVTKKRRVGTVVHQACIHCRISHRACNEARPCNRCVKKNLACLDRDPHDTTPPPTSAIPSTPPPSGPTYITIVMPQHQHSPPVSPPKLNNPKHIPLPISNLKDDSGDSLTKKVQHMDKYLNVLVGTNDWASARSLWDLNELALLAGCTEGFASLLGYSIKEVERDFHYSRVVPDRYADRIVHFYETLKRVSKLVEMVIIMKKKDGSDVFVLSQITVDFQKQHVLMRHTPIKRDSRWQMEDFYCFPSEYNRDFEVLEPPQKARNEPQKEHHLQQFHRIPDIQPPSLSQSQPQPQLSPQPEHKKREHHQIHYQPQQRQLSNQHPLFHQRPRYPFLPRDELPAHPQQAQFSQSPPLPHPRLPFMQLPKPNFAPQTQPVREVASFPLPPPPREDKAILPPLHNICDSCDYPHPHIQAHHQSSNA